VSGTRLKLLLRTLARRPDRDALQIGLHSTAVRLQNGTADGSSSTKGSTHQQREQWGAATLCCQICQCAIWLVVQKNITRACGCNAQLMCCCVRHTSWPCSRSALAAGVGTLPPGTLPMAVPSKEAYERVQVRKQSCSLSAGVRNSWFASSSSCACDKRAGAMSSRRACLARLLLLQPMAHPPTSACRNATAHGIAGGI